jgi:hypothetical protein
MLGQPWYVMILPTLPLLLAHLAGVVVAIILLVRRGGAPAILALVGFGVLFLVDLANLGRDPLIRALAEQTRRLALVGSSVNCCCSVVDVAAIVCLIVALWQAVSGTGGAPAETEPDEEPLEEIVGVFEEVPEEAPRVTRVLDENETLEGTVETSEEIVEEGK